MTRRLSSEQWKTLYRLRAAGCPIDLIEQPTYPLHIRMDTSVGPTRIYPGTSMARVAIPIFISAVEAVTIVSVSLQIESVKKECALVQSALEDGSYSESAGYTDPQSQVKVSWNREDRPFLMIEKGHAVRGYLLLQINQALPYAGVGAVLAGELWLRDSVGRSYGLKITLLDFSTPDGLEDYACQRRSFYDFDVCVGDLF